LGLGNADGAGVVLDFCARGRVAACVPEGALAEHDECLVVGSEVAVPAEARFEHFAELVRERIGRLGGRLELDERPERRLAGVDFA
jgi:hypothetical protein